MIPIHRRGFRGGAAVLLAVLLVSMGVRPARAAGADTTGDDAPKADTKADTKAAGAAPAPTAPASDAEKPPEEPRAVPQLQLEDEGPSSRVARKVRGPRVPVPGADQPDEKPFWKNWVFWTVTGVLVASAIGMVIYSTRTGNSAALDACPADVFSSLGCFGSGRGQ